MTETFPRWLYACFLAVDGNFRLKLKSRGINDPEIGSGWSYFVENKNYMQHISENTIETEVRPNFAFRLQSLHFVRPLAVVPPSTLSIRRTASHPKIT